MPPEVRVVDRAEARAQPPERRDRPLDQDREGDAEDAARDRGRRHDPEPVLEVEVEATTPKTAATARLTNCTSRNSSGRRRVVPVLGPQEPALLVARPSGSRTRCRGRPCAGSRTAASRAGRRRSRTGPVDRDHDLRGEQAVLADPGLGRVGDVVAEEVAAAQLALRTRNEVLEKSAFMIDSPSETIVPVPIVLSNGLSCLTSAPKFEPVCSSGRAAGSRWPAGSARRRAVAEQDHEEAGVGQPGDRPGEPVADAVQRVHGVRRGPRAGAAAARRRSRAPVSIARRRTAPRGSRQRRR